MEKVLLFAVFAFALCLTSVFAQCEDDCSKTTLDASPSDFLCQPTPPFYVYEPSPPTNKGSDLKSYFDRYQQITFNGLDINANGDVFFQNGQSDSDVLDPFKHFIRTRSGLHAETFSLQFGGDASVRTHFATVAASADTINKAAASIVKMTEKFSDFNNNTLINEFSEY